MLKLFLLILSVVIVNASLHAPVRCSLCYKVVDFLIAERRIGVPLKLIALEAEAVCRILRIEPGGVCKGIIEEHIALFAQLVDSNKELSGERVCDLLMQNSRCNRTAFEWTVDLPEGKTVTRKHPSNPETTFNILHIGDIHFDPLYTPGKLKDCDEPLCCQNDQADGNSTLGTACGYWAEYNKSDASEALVDESFRKAAEFDFDYVYFTGDAINHRVWSRSVENNTRDLRNVFAKMKSAFKGKPIYPVLGNHEPSPVNQYAIGSKVDANLSTDWLYGLIASEFSEWLTDSAKEDLMRGGFYTVSPRQGLRIVVLNNNVAYTSNWWLAQNNTDPFAQLAWLAKTLKSAEDNNEIVHILSHIPSGKSDLLEVWSREYHRIIERFANTIAAQFNGHTHKDQFMAYYSSSNKSEVINMAFNGASIMCDRSNPSFKIFNIDRDNFDVIDYEEWTFNLTEANSEPTKPPNWYQLYTFRNSYDIRSLSPSQFSDLLPRLAANRSLLNNYHLFSYRYSDEVVETSCDDTCKKNYLCEIATSQVGEATHCEMLQNIFDENA